MSSKGERERVTISISSADNALIVTECERTGEYFSVATMRLAKLGFEHQAQAAAVKAVVAKAAPRDEPAGLLTSSPDVPAITVAPTNTSTGIVPASAAATSVIPPALVPASRAVLEPTPTGAPASFFERRAKPWWKRTAAGEPSVGSDKWRWSAVGVLSTALALMLVPADSMVAAAVSQTMLGEPGDGIAASNRLFEHYSHRAGPQRHWDAATRLADNQARVKECADRADRFSDYRQLTACEIHVSSRRRAIEVGQGIVD